MPRQKKEYVFAPKMHSSSSHLVLHAARRTDSDDCREDGAKLYQGWARC